MKDIKFRAWDREQNQMYYQGLNGDKPNSIMDMVLQFDELGVGVLVRYWGEQGCNDVKDFELMQYSGVTDKNGKEIYDGDIVKYPSAWQEETLIGEVEFGWGMFTIKDVICWPEATWEVIGNIYENPELLK